MSRQAKERYRKKWTELNPYKFHTVKMKICCECKIEKNVLEFNKHITAYDGLQARCAICSSLESKRRDRKNFEFWSKNDPYLLHLTKIKKCCICHEKKSVNDFAKNSLSKDGLNFGCRACSQIKRRIRIYGVEVKLGKKCCICNTEQNLIIDHSHENGRVRGTLCRKCNSGLGFFKDNFNLLAKAIEYLKLNL